MLGHVEPQFIITVRERSGQLRQLHALSVTHLPGVLLAHLVVPGTGVIAEQIPRRRLVEVRRVEAPGTVGAAAR